MTEAPGSRHLCELFCLGEEVPKIPRVLQILLFSLPFGPKSIIC